MGAQPARTVPDYRGIHVMILLSQSRARKKVLVRSPAYLSTVPHIGEQPMRNHRDWEAQSLPSACTFCYCRTPLYLSALPLLSHLFHFSCQLRADSSAKAKIHSSPRLIFCGFCSFPCSGKAPLLEHELLGGNSPIQLTHSPSIL